MTRKCENWIKTLGEYVEDTESPRHFWLWSGLYIIGATLQRRVWFPFGMETIFPNLFILLVAPPGWSRKGAPIGFAKRIIEDIQLPVGIDSPTKRHLTQRLAALSETEHFFWKGLKRVQAPLALVSKELSSFLAVEPKGMIEAITDLYDSHDKWDYGTSGKGEDFIRNVCISCFFATTPDWIACNLPQEAIGGGFTSRFIIVSGQDCYKEVSWPSLPNLEIYKKLKIDLETISHLSGEFIWEPTAFERYQEWYGTIRGWANSIGDDRLFNNFSRVHVQVVKTAMCLHVARDDTLIVEPEDIETAITLIKAVYGTASEAFASHGHNPMAVVMNKIIKQCRLFKQITVGKLLLLNCRDVTKKGLLEILENLEIMKLVKLEYSEATKTTFVHWISGGKK